MVLSEIIPIVMCEQGQGARIQMRAKIYLKKQNKTKNTNLDNPILEQE